MSPETVFIVDDDASVRDALGLLLGLEGVPTMPFASAEAFLQAWQPTWRGCLVLDLRMAGMGGLELQALLRERGSRLPVVVITAHGDVNAARQAFLADAVDFLEKPFDPEMLLAAVQRALRRGDGTPPPPVPVAAQGEAALSPRERDVLGLLVQGLPNRRIAEALGISHRTVEVHKSRVLEKLNASSVVELVRRYQGPA